MITQGVSNSIELVWSRGPRSTESLQFDWKEGQSVLHALWTHSSLLAHVLKWNPSVSAQTTVDELTFKSHVQQLKSQGELFLSVWGHPCELETLLKPLDRIEVSRALKVDPKVARRERFQAQGAKSAGLFAKKRPGAKSGY